MKKNLSPFLFLIIITAFVYLPNIGSLTYFKDDWYYIYDGLIGGAKIFHEMFRIDRPARGYFFEWYFLLLGAKPLAWHISAYIWRALSALGSLWIFNILWQKEKRFAFISALLFALYPGYYWWMSAIEYQPMIASLALQVFSIAFTLKTITNYQLPITKTFYMVSAILTGWAYIALVDYAIGMEVFRFLAVYILIARNEQNFWKRIRAAFYGLNLQLLIPIGFLAWRFFFFNNQREATDIGLQLGAFFGDPINTGVRWALQTLNSLLNMTALAWTNQMPRFFLDLRMRDMASGFLFAALTLLAVFIARKTSGGDSPRAAESDSMLRESALLGGLGLIFGIMPIIMANRYINNEVFSHYALPASLSAALFVSSIVHSISSRRIQTVMTYMLVMFAALAHYGIAMSAVNEERALEKFWWQVGWRAPMIKPNTLLVIRYPSANMGDDGNGAIEAANAFYYREAQPQVPVMYPLAALTLSDANIQTVLSGKLNETVTYRTHTTIRNFDNLLGLSQPAPTSCVHVIDGSRPLVSARDSGNVILSAPLSNIQNVDVRAEFSAPPEFMFGKEPEHGWCYYFEKADLALQLGDWQTAADLGETAIKKNLSPEDRSEWLTFLYAYALTGNETRVKQTASKINDERALRLQACEMLTDIEDSLKPEIRELVSTLYCKTK